MKIAGKSPSNTAVAVAVDADGIVKVRHIWEIASVVALNEIPTDTTAHYLPSASTNYDVSDYAIVAIRVRNRAGAPVNIKLADKGNYIYNSNQESNQITIDTNSAVIITADDWNCLNVIPEFALRYQFLETPNGTGKLEITIYKKR